MAKYTIEDIEILRQKSGISYEEAVNLLEYHNGSLARALVDLEKNGRLKKEGRSAQNHKGWKGFFHFLYHFRLKVKKGDVVIANLSALFMLIVLATAPHVCVISLIFSLVLGYQFSFERNSREFADSDFDDLMKNAKENVQQAVNGIARQFSQSGEKKTAEKPEDQPSRTESAPSGTRPVNVQFPNEGSVNVRDDGDGYHEADIR